MNVLGIETSCDETSAAVVTDGRQVLSNIVSSSLSLHSKYGGVIPEIAFRMQMETIAQVVDTAMQEAGIRINDVGLIAVTHQPGLLGSLLVGVSFAKGVHLARGIPLLGVNHLYSHMYAPFVAGVATRFPFVGLIVSGGHTSLYLVKGFDSFELLGATQDDACGEAFDKVAKILSLGYPGGPVIERRALTGDPHRIAFKCCDTRQPFDFSFSGIKTAVLYCVQKHKKRGVLARTIVDDICASFQETAIEALVHKSLAACKKKGVRRLVIGGGVAANSFLRDMFQKKAAGDKIEVYFPSKALCMDNAAMVAGLGFQLFKKKQRSDLFLTACSYS